MNNPKKTASKKKFSEMSPEELEAARILAQQQEKERAERLMERVKNDIRLMCELGIDENLFRLNRAKVSKNIKCAYPKKIDKETIRFLPSTRYSGKPIIVDSAELALNSIDEILQENLLGFDTETRPNFGKGKHHTVSILQLAGASKVWIFMLHRLDSILPEIYKIFEKEDIKKVGVAVHGDIKSLKEHCDFEPKGFIDIAEYTQPIGIVNTGLRNLTALFFGERLSKAAQLSNWENYPLEPKQIEYAATDAWISRRLFVEVLRSLNIDSHMLEPDYPYEKPRISIKLIFRKMGKLIKKITDPDEVKFVFKKTKKKILKNVFGVEPKKKSKRYKKRKGTSKSSTSKK